METQKNNNQKIAQGVTSTPGLDFFLYSQEGIIQVKIKNNRIRTYYPGAIKILRNYGWNIAKRNEKI